MDLSVPHIGDFIESVNGVGTLEVPDVGALSRNQQGRQVLLKIRSGGGGSMRAVQSRDLVVVPTTNESNLRYSDWEYFRRRVVEEQSDGTMGYVHLRAMGGGNIDSFILEKLMRQAWMYWKENVGNPSWNMQYAFRGHMVVLVDQDTYSSGSSTAAVPEQGVSV